MNLFNRTRVYFSQRVQELKLAKYVEALGEVAAQEELLAYYRRRIKLVDQEVLFWEYAQLKQAILDTTEHLERLVNRSNSLRPEGWYGKE